MGALLTGDRFLALAALIASTSAALWLSAPYRHSRSTR